MTRTQTAYQPADGDRVTVIRTTGDGRTGSWTGRVSRCHIERGQVRAFQLDGKDSAGKPFTYYMNNSPAELRHKGISHTVTPA